jgi:thiol-disulfide isomerase/thioredoxin
VTAFNSIVYHFQEGEKDTEDKIITNTYLKNIAICGNLSFKTFKNKLLAYYLVGNIPNTYLIDAKLLTINNSKEKINEIIKNNYPKTKIIIKNATSANFINPEIADNQNHPTNVFGVKLQRQVEAEQNIVAIIGFAKEFDLLLFADESCRYCREFAPVLKRFVNQHHFQLDIASLDSKAGNIAKSLGITSIPTLVAVKKDGFLLFEVSRGVVSTSELEANILLASKYSQELAVKKKQGDQGKRKQHKSRGYSG